MATGAPTTLGLLCAAVLACVTAPAHGAPQAWQAPRPASTLGLLAVTCDAREFCFALACPEQQLQLVNMSPGGGPYGNPGMGAAGEVATLTSAGERFRLEFQWDDAILPALGIAGSRAALPPAALVALARRGGTIRGITTGSVEARLPSAGLRALWPRLASACGVPPAP